MSPTLLFGSSTTDTKMKASHSDSPEAPKWKRPVARPQESTGDIGSQFRHPMTGELLKPTLSPAEAALLLGWPERTVREHARLGLLPTMERRGPKGQHRIITAKLLEILGLLPQSK